MAMSAARWKTASQPATASLLPDLVPPDDLLPAVSLTQMTWNTGRFVGPMLAALGIAMRYAFG